mmetsp:Transcript_5494/g.12200  ORF Transcript_5494/g.12200 Transcript_5494/m.12200 type:complete len:229 (-) Transcript_5494:3067-3753(-)
MMYLIMALLPALKELMLLCPRIFDKKVNDCTYDTVEISSSPSAGGHIAREVAGVFCSEPVPAARNWRSSLARTYTSTESILELDVKSWLDEKCTVTLSFLIARSISSSVRGKSYQRFAFRFVLIDRPPMIVISRGTNSGIDPTSTRTATIAKELVFPPVFELPPLTKAPFLCNLAVSVQPSRDGLMINSLLFKDNFFFALFGSLPTQSPPKIRLLSSLTLNMSSFSNM